MDRLTRRAFLKGIGVAAAGGLGAGRPAGNGGPDTGRPNVVFILTDQQRWDALGVAGNRILRTPHLDRLARGGVFFDQATCASPLCGPSRAALLTGCLAFRHRCPGNVRITGRGGLAEGVPTFDELLHAEGYLCAYHGKWHTGPGHRECYEGGLEPYLDLYTKEMSDRFPALARAPAEGRRRDRYTKLLYRPFAVDSMMRAARRRGFRMPHHPEAGESPLAASDSLTAWTVARAVAFLRSRPKQPFSLTCSILHPHAPLIATRPYSRLFDPAKMPMPSNVEDDQPLPPSVRCVPGAVPLTPGGLGTFMALYFGLVAEVDHHVGRILAALDEAGLARNTLVVFTSDHGEMMGSHGTLSKMRFFEEAFRVPLILRFPGRIPEGRRLSAPATGFDLAPTILDYAGVVPPRRGFAGRSLRPVIEGREKAPLHAYGELGRPRRRVRCLRSERWKLILPVPRRGRARLYDLKEDPGEVRDLLLGRNRTRASLARAEELREELKAHLVRSGDPGAAELPPIA